MMVFEDIHFSDPSLLDLIEYLASRVQDVPLLMIATSRPELLTSRPTWAGGLLTSRTVSLEPLSARGCDRADRQAVRAARARGTRGSGRLAGRLQRREPAVHRGAHRVARRAIDEGREPAAGQHPRASSRRAWTRCRHPSETWCSTRRSWERCSGRGVLERLRPDRVDLPALLGSLERRDLIRREASSSIKGEQQFSFKHGLIREVAYLTLPRDERRRCHRTTAEYLEDVSLRAGDAEATLAYHWREAGDADKALEYLLAAADLAGRGWAKARAARLYAQALELVPEDKPELKTRHRHEARGCGGVGDGTRPDVEAARGRPGPARSRASSSSGSGGKSAGVTSPATSYTPSTW